MMQNSAALLLLIGAFTPIFITLLLVLRRSRATGLMLSPWAAVPALIAALIVPASSTTVTIPGALLGSEVGFDQTGKTFLLFTALLWAVAGIYARAYISRALQVRFYLFFLLTLAGNLRLIIAQDMLGFYFGYALMSFASYGLVVFAQTAAAHRAGRVYIILMVASELLLFAAFVLAAHAAGGTSFELVREALMVDDNRSLVIALALTGFGIKTGILGLHMWLPLAHSQAPTPASAVLSGAMVKAGVLGWLRLLPIGAGAIPDWGTVFMVMGLSAAFYGVVVGLTQNVAKTVLAYSSVSQMGLVTAAVGMGLLAPQTWPALLPIIAFFALQHSLNKGALFLGVGLGGDNHRLPSWWLWALLAIPAAALAGAPWSSGMLAKLLLKKQAAYLPEFWAQWVPMLLPLSATATALLLARFLFLLRPQEASRRVWPASGLLWPWLLLVATAQVIPWVMAPQIPHLNLAALWGGLWPLLLTLLVAIVAARWPLLRNRRPLPAGDLLVIFTIIANRSAGQPRRAANQASRLRWHSQDTAIAVAKKVLSSALVRAEAVIFQWHVAMILAVSLGALIVWQTR